MQGEDEFAEAAVDEVKGRDGIKQDKEKGRKKKEERRKHEGEVEMKDEGNKDDSADHADGDVEQVVAKSLLLLGSFALNERFVVRAEDFAQKGHTGLRKQSDRQAENKRCDLKGLTQIGRDARTEEIGQRGEEEVERAGETEDIIKSHIPFD